MSKYEQIVERLQEINPEAVLLTGLEDALMGTAVTFGKSAVALYDYDKCVEVYSREMPKDDAVDFIEFNIIGAHFSEHNPVFFMGEVFIE